MGVKGLWTILEPAGEPVAQSTLRGHRLAVDASIWMYQLTKALPDASTGTTSGYNPLVLAGLLKRILKLMHFGIRPVFVFDGATPELKATTVRDRRGRRAEAESRYKSLAKKMLKIRLRMHALGKTDGTGEDLAAKPVAEGKNSSELEEESSEEELFDIDYEQLDRLDIASPDFQCLPLDLKQELLSAMKERALAEGKSSRIAGFSKDALTFSHGQIEALVKRRRLAAELERVSRSSFGAFGAPSTAEGGQSYRIASSSTREFILVKNQSGAGWSFDRHMPEDAVIPNKSNSSSSPAKRTIEQDQEEDAAFERMFFGEEPIKAEPLPVQLPKTSVSAAEPVKVEDDREEEENVSEPEPKEEAQFSSEIESEDELLEASEIIGKAASKAIPVAPISKAPSQPETKAIAVETVEILGHEKVTEGPPASIPSPPIDEIEEEEDLEDFLEAFRNTTKEDLEARLRQSLIDAQSGLRAAQGEARGLESELLADFKHLLALFGLPFMDAEAEAEAQCAWLHAHGLVDGVITDDSDIWLFAPAESSLLVYRNFFKEGRAVVAFGGPRISMQLDLRREDLVCLAMWLGGDYGTGVRGLGTARAISLLRILKRSQTYQQCKEDAGLEYCLALLNLFRAAQEDLDAARAEWTLEDQQSLDKILRHVHHLDADFPSSRIIEAYLEPAVSQDTRPFRWQLPNPVGLEAFFSARLGWPAERTRSQLLPVLRTTKDNVQ
jgi:5'-3' exonuclease